MTIGESGGSDTILSQGGGVAVPGARLAEGEVVGGYAIEAVAGSGGMGVVYRARDVELGRTVALKLIGGGRADEAAVRELFVRESLVAASLEHPNVLPVYRAGEDDGRLFIAMRFVEGASLADLIAASPGGIPPGRAARIVARVADALDAAHARGLVHRDVKPANILIADPDGDEHVYLGDFGLAAPVSGAASRGGGWAGTLAYLAPEQVRGDALDARTDVYALGCVLFHALTGRPPFGDREQQAVLDAHLQAKAPVPSDVVAGLPAALDDVVRRALAKRPDDRFATAGELGRAALAARYDVALLTDPAEEAAAEALATGLRGADVLPLVVAAQDARAAEGVRAAGACAVLVGRGGLGDWAREGLVAARGVAAHDRAFRLALVLLPGAPDPGDPSLAYLADHPWVDLRAGAGEPMAAADLVRALRGADVPAGLPADAGVPPYRGLEAFREEDAGLYVGREHDVARLLERLRAGRFVAVVGPSGSGKSSLAHAGLLPALRRDGALDAGDWRVLTMQPGARPLAALAAQLAHLPGAGSPTAADLAADERALDLAAARALEGRPAGERVLVVVDQLEEAFTLCGDDGERAAFLGNLVYAATIPGGRAVVVATMRADFYHRLAEHPELRGLVASQQLLLGPLDARALRRVIEEPARRCGLELEPGLTRRILTDVADRPGTLPLLEHLLLELWRRRRDRTLTLEAYGASGGVEGALARRANTVYGAMPPERQAIARRVLLRLTLPGEGTEDTRRRAERRELVTDPGEQAEVDAVVDALAEARLVTTGVDEATGAPVVEVTHEALIRGWPELRGWLDEDRDRLRAERRLADAAAEWDRGGRDEGALYRGARLAAWGERDTSSLIPLEREFLAASTERAERDRQARRRRVRIAIASLSVALAAIVAVAIFALIQRNDATDQRDLATSRQLAGSATLARQRDPELATLLAEDGYAASPTVEAEDSLRQSVHDSKIRAALRLPGEPVVAAVPMPGGRIAVVSQKGNFRVWDPAKDRSGAAPTLVGTWPAGIESLTATPAGYVTGGSDGAIVLWPGSDAPGAPERIAGVEGPIYNVHAVPGGDRVIVATPTGAYLMGLADHRLQPIPDGAGDAVPDPAGGGYFVLTAAGGLERVGGSSAPTSIPIGGFGLSLAASPDGNLLAVGTTAGVEVFRLGPRPTRVFSRPDPGGVNDVAWSEDGSRVDTAGGTGVVRVFDREGRLLSVLLGHSGAVLGAGWNGPTSAVSLGSDGTVREWDAAAGVENELAGHTPAFSGGATFDARGSHVAIVQADSSVERWSPGRPVTSPVLPAIPGTTTWSGAVEGGLVAVGLQATPGGFVVRDASSNVLAEKRYPDDTAAGVALDPRGRRVAAALSPSGQVVIMDLTPGAKPRIVARHEHGAFAVAFSPDGRTLASGGQDSTVKVWDPAGGSRVVGTHDGQVTSVAFSPDGRWLASGSGDKTVRVWDLTEKEPVTIIRSHQGSVSSVTFAGDDRIVSGGADSVQVTDWRRGVTLLTIPDPADVVSAAGPAPAIAYYALADGVIHALSCDVCGPIDAVKAEAAERTTRDLTETEKNDFHVGN